MDTTLVIQSHRHPLPAQWIGECLASVHRWADIMGFDYRFMGDELFDALSPEIIAKTREQVVVASDLARLKWMQRHLFEGYRNVIWCDADFLIFDPVNFMLPAADFALGREIWVQPNGRGRLKVYHRVHNAFLMFRRNNHFLDFYADAAERLLMMNKGSVPPQFIGPKLLSALHNLIVCPVMETAAMFSPQIIRDLLGGDGKALDAYRMKSSITPAGANLCSSLTVKEGFSEADMQRLIRRLNSDGF